MEKDEIKKSYALFMFNIVLCYIAIIWKYRDTIKYMLQTALFYIKMLYVTINQFIAF